MMMYIIITIKTTVELVRLVNDGCVLDWQVEIKKGLDYYPHNKI